MGLAQYFVCIASVSIDLISSIMQDPIVETQNGLLRGITKNSTDGYSYCAFLGIPYAKPPVESLRFKDPEPIDNWEGIKEVKEYGNVCAQYDTTGNFAGSEDCLYLNVCVRSLQNVEVLKPVMVWIHGGGLMHGCGCDRYYGPDYLLRKDIVLVSFNYRLGVFGFLNLEHEIAPGNQGLKDQVMALKWIQANIIKFGGDPNNVTAFGESAGAVSIQILSLSPIGKGLFHKAIYQSCSVYNPWVDVKNPKKYAFQMCTYMGRYSVDPEQIFSFLSSLDSKKLVKVQSQVIRATEKLHGIFPFTLGVDDKSSNPILPVQPAKLMSQFGIQMPILMGHNSAEGLAYLMGLKADEFDKVNRNLDRAINENASAVLKKYNLTKKDLKYMYFGDEKISIKNCDKLANMLGDLTVLEGIHRLAKLLVGKNTFPTYFYQFSYDEELSLMKAVLPKVIKGSCHFDEVEYLFYGNFRLQRGCTPLRKGTLSYKVMERMTELWTNFAKYGTPTPASSELLPVIWEPLNDGKNLKYMDIGRTLQMKTMVNVEQHFLNAKTTIEKSLKKSI